MGDSDCTAHGEHMQTTSIWSAPSVRFLLRCHLSNPIKRTPIFVRENTVQTRAPSPTPRIHPAFGSAGPRESASADEDGWARPEGEVWISWRELHLAARRILTACMCVLRTMRELHPTNLSIAPCKTHFRSLRNPGQPQLSSLAGEVSQVWCHLQAHGGIHRMPPPLIRPWKRQPLKHFRLQWPGLSKSQPFQNEPTSPKPLGPRLAQKQQGRSWCSQQLGQ